MNLAHLIIFLASLAGLSIASYIHYKKKGEKPMVCPLNSRCDIVIESQYSKFLSMPVELLGMAYYFIMILIYGTMMALPFLMTPLVSFVLFAITVMSFLFSLYLTFIQAFVVRHWCAWCLSSAALCAIIFFSAWTSATFPVAGILLQYGQLILTVHMIGLALGIGGATITDIFFMKFLKDFKISVDEAGILHILSQVIWFALGILVVSGIFLYIPNAAVLNHSPKFLVKLIAVGVVMINGSMLNLIVAPQLVHISFKKEKKNEEGGVSTIRKLAYALGAISIISWYSVLAFGMTPRTLPISFNTYLLGYGALLIVGVTISQIVEYISANRGAEYSRATAPRQRRSTVDRRQKDRRLAKS